MPQQRKRPLRWQIVGVQHDDQAIRDADQPGGIGRGRLVDDADHPIYQYGESGSRR